MADQKWTVAVKPWCALFLLGACVWSLAPYSLHAQEGAEIPVQPRARSVAFFADSVATAGDTARAVAMLESAVRANRKDGPAWHQLGLLLWNQARSKRGAHFISDLRVIQLLTGADSSLRMATQVSPDSARFWLSLTDFNGSSGVSTAQFASGGTADRAVVAAENAGDSLQLAIALNRVGLTAWRRYEPIAKRALSSDNRPVEIDPMALQRRDEAAAMVTSFAKRIEPPTGDVEYKRAAEHFRRALQVAPTNQRFARNVYMVLGEREQWSEMLALARHRASIYPFDFQARLAMGLAAHRLGKGFEAQVAFDSALVLMDDRSRARMTAITRILRPVSFGVQPTDRLADARAFGRLSQAEQDAVASLYWLMADPLAITQENEYRNEFLARVTWADFRWTWDEHDLLGADTDRGDIHIRYGPPRLEMTVGGTGMDSRVTLTWLYEGGLVFFFEMTPGFLSAYTSWLDKDNIDQLRNAVPVSFANVPSTRLLDTIPVLVTRFRGSADSTDIVVAASIPVDSMVRDLEVDRVPVVVDMRIFDRFAAVRGIDSSRLTVVPASTRTPIDRSWTRRIGPGLNVLRVEALQADSRRAARSVTRLDGDLPAGFGMSDILLGSAPRPGQSSAPRSWRDIETTPNPGIFRSAQVGLVWEIYDAAAREGQAKYNIEVAVERVHKGLARFSARIVDGVGRTLGREERGMNRLVIRFDRVAPAASTLVEYLTINLGQASAGEYRLQVVITDQETGQKTSRSTAFHIR
jgi:GWxTD domain-containing protein